MTPLRPRRRGVPRLLPALLALAGVVVVPAGPAVGAESESVTETVTLECTGAPVPWTVPAEVTRIGVELIGAPGGTGTAGLVPSALPLPSGGAGGTVTATLATTPGETLTFTVGCPGGDAAAEVGGGGGFGGTAGGDGGDGGDASIGGTAVGATSVGGAAAGGGGGSSDVRQGGTALAHRVVVAGGGGGGGGIGGGVCGAGAGPSTCGGGGGSGGVTDCGFVTLDGSGGVGGGPTGADGSAAGSCDAGAGGSGGGPSGDGPGGGAPCGGFASPGSAGADGAGGAGGGAGDLVGPAGGGGGGGGYFGGGGGGACAGGGGGGGGGAGFVGPGATGAVKGTTTTGPGRITITYTRRGTVPDPAVPEPAFTG